MIGVKSFTLFPFASISFTLNIAFFTGVFLSSNWCLNNFNFIGITSFGFSITNETVLVASSTVGFPTYFIISAFCSSVASPFNSTLVSDIFPFFIFTFNLTLTFPNTFLNPEAGSFSKMS